MPERYHIHVVPTKHRFERVGRSGTSDWREDCSRCKSCVKLRCLYDNYESEGDYNRDPSEPVEPVFECKACLSCVQGCTKGLLSMALNPEYQALGDHYWKPEIIATTWDQAEAGRIPVSGAGYRGPFSGPGFDAMWTDMSEIVRPTRDGIHGREYINTSVDIGANPSQLLFDVKGALQNQSLLVEVQLPVLLDAAPWGDAGENILKARIKAAAALKTLAVIKAGHLPAVPAEERCHTLPVFEGQEGPECLEALAQCRLVEVADGPECLALVEQLRKVKKDLLVGVRLPLTPEAAARVLELHEAGVPVVHLCADFRGRELSAEKPRFVKEMLREIHGVLVKKGVRNEMTLIAGGGIALAEHTIKAIICGADMVAVDIPLQVALGCRVCGHNGFCPVGISEVPLPYAVQRMVNLMRAWHSQMLEMLGAMGIREVRRLRGEVGRAMFMEDLERDAFKDLARSAG